MYNIKLQSKIRQHYINISYSLCQVCRCNSLHMVCITALLIIFSKSSIYSISKSCAVFVNCYYSIFIYTVWCADAHLWVRQIVLHC